MFFTCTKVTNFTAILFLVDCGRMKIGEETEHRDITFAVHNEVDFCVLCFKILIGQPVRGWHYLSDKIVQYGILCLLVVSSYEIYETFRK